MESDLSELVFSRFKEQQHDNNEPSCINVQDR